MSDEVTAEVIALTGGLVFHRDDVECLYRYGNRTPPGTKMEIPVAKLRSRTNRRHGVTQDEANQAAKSVSGLYYVTVTETAIELYRRRTTSAETAKRMAIEFIDAIGIVRLARLEARGY